MELLDDDSSFKQRDEQTIRDLKISIMDELKAIKHGRGALLVMVGLTILGIVLSLFLIDDAMAVLIEGVILVGTFVWAFWYSSTNPKIAFIMATAVYWLHFLLTIALSPEFGLKGIIVRIIVTIYLVKAIVASMKFMTVKEELEKHGEIVKVPAVFDY